MKFCPTAAVVVLVVLAREKVPPLTLSAHRELAVLLVLVPPQLPVPSGLRYQSLTELPLPRWAS